MSKGPNLVRLELILSRGHDFYDPKGFVGPFLLVLPPCLRVFFRLRVRQTGTFYRNLRSLLPIELALQMVEMCLSIVDIEKPSRCNLF